MALTVLNKCVIIFFIIKCCISSENLRQDGENITKLYELIAGAVNDDLNKPQIYRRVINDSGYLIHINKLKDVNGLKMHNIVINHTDTNSTIYINNPLESKLPHPFMTLEEFKNKIVEQQLNDRKEFLRSKKIEEDRKKWADIRATAKLKLKHTSPKLTNTKQMSNKETQSIGTNTNSIKGKDSFSKVENKLKTVTTKVITTATKDKQNTKEHMNETVKENSAGKILLSTTIAFQEKNNLSTVRSRVQPLSFDQDSAMKLTAETHKTSLDVSGQSITTVPEAKHKNNNDKKTTTITTITGREKISDKYEELTNLREKSSIDGETNSTNINESRSTVTETKSTDSDEVESRNLDEESSTTETEPTASDEVQSTTVDENEAANDDEEEYTTVPEETDETTTESSTMTTTPQTTTTRERWSEGTKENINITEGTEHITIEIRA